jgi:hypothetical protein
VLVIGILEARVFLDLCRVGKMYLVTFGHQQIYQPIPVIGRLYCDAGDVFLERFQGLYDDCRIVQKLPFEHSFATLIDDAKIRIV